MIKNERQYRISKAQLAALNDAFSEVSKQPRALNRLQVAEEEALQSQIQDLQMQVEEYEMLTSGKQKVLSLESFEEFPSALIKARIAAGLSQKQLAERLGVKEQQIQRYESTDYASASLERIQEIINILGLRIHEDIILSNVSLSFDYLISKLSKAGLDRDFILNRLIPHKLLAYLEDPHDTSDPDILLLRAASAIGKIFGWSTSNIFGPDPLKMNMSVVSTTRYKTSKRVDEQRTSAYTLYAHFLALLLLEATPNRVRKSIPTDPQVLRKEIIDTYGSFSFEYTLRYIWALGIPVLPLADTGAFHGACWRVDGHNIIVLKQSVRSPARWLFDLLHELYHASQHLDQPQLMVLEHNELAKERLDMEEERQASQFAGDVLLNGRSEELVQLCVDAANGSVELLKKTLPKVAKAEHVRPDVLANYMAFRLSLQDVNWWGTANNLQVTTSDPWLIARDIVLENINLEVLNETDRSLLLQALSD